MIYIRMTKILEDSIPVTTSVMCFILLLNLYLKMEDVQITVQANYNNCEMISSSNFFKKTFFTLEPVKGKKNTKEPYGPWQEEDDPIQIHKNRRHSTKNRYAPRQFSTIDRENSEERTNRTEMSKSLLLSGEHSLVMGFSREKTLRDKKNKIIREKVEKQQTKLPAIKINESQNDSLRKSILKLEGGLLNFITNNNQKSLKKFVSKREEPGPKFEMYKKCLIAARRMMQQGQYNSLFHKD